MRQVSLFFFVGMLSANFLWAETKQEAQELPKIDRSEVANTGGDRQVVLEPLLLAGEGVRATIRAPEPVVLYVHGFRPGRTTTTPQCHLQSSCGYWGSTDPNLAVRIVGYDGRLHPLVHGAERGITRMLDALNRFCRRDMGQRCRIVNHSMGGLVTGYVIANYNRTNIYNIEYVSSLVSAEGGSELANIGDPVLRTLNAAARGLIDWFFVFPDAVRALTTSAARGAYDHNRNNGVLFYHIAGDVPTFGLNALFNGDHDTVVAFHSTCSYRIVEDFTQCGGQSITTGSLFWKETTYHEQHTGHHNHPRVPVTGVGTSHIDFVDIPQYTDSRL